MKRYYCFECRSTTTLVGTAMQQKVAKKMRKAIVHERPIRVLT